jgi:cytochrome c
MRIQTVNLCLIILCSTFAAMSGTAAANERGEKVFRRCQACHTLEDGGQELRGPNLHGVFGRQAGTKDGYKFSNAFEASEVTWTEKTLDQFLAEPRTFIAGNKMAFPAVRKPEDRADLIAYLREATK